MCVCEKEFVLSDASESTLCRTLSMLKMWNDNLLTYVLVALSSIDCSPRDHRPNTAIISADIFLMSSAIACAEHTEQYTNGDVDRHSLGEKLQHGLNGVKEALREQQSSGLQIRLVCPCTIYIVKLTTRTTMYPDTMP